MKHKAAYAGAFYPGKTEELSGLIDKMIADVPASALSGDKPNAVIVPHAGYIYSGPTAAYAYALLQKYSFSQAIVIGPSHRHPFRGIAFADYSEWETPLGTMPVPDTTFPETEEEIFLFSNTVLSTEHSIEVQLPFLQKMKSIKSWLPLVTGALYNYQESAEAINLLLDDNTILIISSDLSHFLDYEDCRLTDNETIQQILKLSPLDSRERACGHEPIEIVRHLALSNGWKPELLRYQNSGDTAGDKNRVVGYASIAFYQ